MKISELILMLQALDQPNAEIKVSLPTDAYDVIEEFTIVGLLDPWQGEKHWSVLGIRPGKSVIRELWL